MDFVTLGMFIIDEIHYQPPRKPDVDVIGGAGTYAALGARLFRPPPSASGIGWIVHEGYDFPGHIKSTIDSWQTRCESIQTPERETTRARNRYEPNGHRAFEYLSTKIRLDETSLTLAQLTSKTYHLICSAQRCSSLIKGILARRDAELITQTDRKIQSLLTVVPIFIWEPVPDLCKPSELIHCLEALQRVDIFSPNLEEFGSLLGTSIDLDQPDGWSQLRQRCQEVIEPTLSSLRTTAVIRLGERGCYVAQPGRRYLRLPAYYDQQPDSSGIDTAAADKREHANRVIDPTGGGNAFLGGFAIGLQHSGQGNMRDAAAFGTIAASFAIEQVGVPTLGLSSSGVETWNGASVEARLKDYIRKVAEAGTRA